MVTEGNDRKNEEIFDEGTGPFAKEPLNRKKSNVLKKKSRKSVVQNKNEDMWDEEAN